MFKPISFTLLLVLSLGGLCASAQESKAGSTMISIGGGYGNLSSSVGGAQTTSTPEVNGTVDYFVIKNYSVGVSGAYQNVNTYDIYGGFNGRFTSESLSRFNLSLRSIFYFTTLDNPVFYVGLRIGYDFFRDVYMPYSPYNGTTDLDPNLNTTTFQVFGGIRAYITPAFSTYFEFGSGLPYYAELGFSFSIGGKPTAMLPAASNEPAGPAPYVH